MPIKRLVQAAAFPKIGTLRKGAPKSGNRPGSDLQYFRFDTDDAEAAQDFAAAYGSEPAAINCYLPNPTPDQNFEAWQEEYVAGGLRHRCDGEMMTIHLLQDGTYSTEPKPCPYHAGTAKRTAKEPGCKPVGRLSVIIPELKRFAYVTVGTTSINDIMELSANLNAVYAMRGSLQGVPFVLTRRPKSISTPTDSGGRRRFEKWLLFIEPDPAWVRVQLDGMRQQALLPTGAKLLTDGRTVTEDGEIDGYLENEDPAPVTVPGAILDPADGQPYEPLDPDGDEGDPFGDEAAQIDAPKLTAGQLKRLHALGTEVYGKANWDTKRAELVQAVTKGQATSSSDLTPDEASKLIAGLESKLQPQAA